MRAAVRCDVAAGEYVADLVRRRAGCARWWTACNWTPPAAAATPAGCAAPPSPQAHNLQVSAHCAPALHAPVAAAVPNLRHVEWFIDHARLEPKLFTGLPTAAGGLLTPDTTRPGHGMSLAATAAHYRR